MHQNWPSFLLHNFGWFFTTLLFLFASIDLRCPPMAKMSNSTNQRISFCWMAFPTNFCFKNAKNSRTFMKERPLLNECAIQLQANHGNCGASVAAALLVEQPFEWVKRSTGNKRRTNVGRSKSMDFDGKDEAFLFQMDEVPKAVKVNFI